jgi:hypothetical protein
VQNTSWVLQQLLRHYASKSSDHKLQAATDANKEQTTMHLEWEVCKSNWCCLTL